MHWQYVGQTADTRLSTLQRGLAVADVAMRLQLEATVVCFHREPADYGPSCFRAVFCVRASSELYDLTMNAPTGYRGAYFESVESGMQANRKLIDAMTPTLLKWLSERDAGRTADAHCSLKGDSAKIWLAEEQRCLCPSCGEWSPGKAPLRIENNRWEKEDHQFAHWGCEAPELTKLRFFGAFIDAEGQEWYAPHKVPKLRADSINRRGWA